MVHYQYLSGSDSSDGYLSSGNTLTFNSSVLIHSSGYADLNRSESDGHLYVLMNTKSNQASSIEYDSIRQYPILYETSTVSDVHQNPHCIQINLNKSAYSDVSSNNIFASSKNIKGRSSFQSVSSSVENSICYSMRSSSINRSLIGRCSRRVFLYGHDFQLGEQELFANHIIPMKGCNRICDMNTWSHSLPVNDLLLDGVKASQKKKSNLIFSPLFLLLIIYNCVVICFILLLLLSNSSQQTVGLLLVI